MIYRLITISVLLVLTLSLLTCSKDEVTPREYPRVKTMEVSSISKFGATFNAEITYPGNGDIIEYGFVWGSEDPSLYFSEKRILAEEISTGIFSSEIATTLKEGVTYFVRAYAKNDKYLVYGKSVMFKSLGSGAPIILDFFPKEGVIGDTVHISGRNFSYKTYTNIVRFNNIKARVLYFENSDSTLNVLVPKEIDSLHSAITIELAANKSSDILEPFTLKEIGFTNISPSEGHAGDTVVITGANFGFDSEVADIYFDETIANIITINDSFIKMTVPYLKGISTCTINVKIGIQSLNPIEFDYLEPKLINFSPKEVTWGDTVNVEIDNLHTDIDFLIFMDNSIISLVNNDYENLKFIVPSYLSKPEITLKFKIGGFDYLFDEKIILKRAEISSVDPTIVSFGEKITINGSYFHPTNNYLEIHYTNYYNTSSVERVQLSSGTREKLEFSFPNLSKIRGSEVGDNILEYILNVNGQTFNLNGFLTLKTPKIDSFSPAIISNVGEHIVIKGSGYDSNTIVEYNSLLLDILEIAEDQITVAIPSSFVENTNVGFRIEKPLVVRNGNNMEVKSSQQLKFDNSQPWSDIDTEKVLNLDNRRLFRAWSNNGRGYILGGVNNNITEYYDDYWEFDPINQKWKELTSIPSVYAGKLKKLAFGSGSNSYIIIEDITNLKMLEYNHLNNSWVALNDPPEIVTNGALIHFSIDNRQFIISTDKKMIYEYIIDTDQWIEVVTTPESRVLSWYPYNGKVTISYPTSEYEFDPANSTLTFIEKLTSSNDFFDHNDLIFSYEQFNSSIFSFNPISKVHTFEAEFPYLGVMIRHCFSLDNIHYFINGQQHIVGYDPNF